MSLNSYAPWANDGIIERDLECGDVHSIISMDQFLTIRNRTVDYTNEVLAVLLRSGRVGVFKPEENNEVWDHGGADAEVAAYNASRLLKLHCVPPTVIRVIDSRRGSVQLFVESEYDSCDLDQFQECMRSVDPESLAALRIFDFIFGQWDRRLSNIIFVRNRRQTFACGVDNTKVISTQQAVYGERPFVSVLEHESLAREKEPSRFPFEFARTMIIEDLSIFQNQFGFDAGKQLAAIYSACKGMRVRYVVWRRQLWQQPFAFDAEERRSIKPFSDHFPRYVDCSFKCLDMPMLNKIFAHADDKARLEPHYFNSILARRDQVQQYFRCITAPTQSRLRVTEALT